MSTRSTYIAALLIFFAVSSPSCFADTGKDMSIAAKSIIATLSAVWDGNEILWSKVNVEQVNIAIDNLRNAVIELEHKKNIAKEQILMGESPQLSVYVPEVQSISQYLGRFANAIDQATGSAALGDSLRQATQSLAVSKGDSIAEATEALRAGNRTGAIALLNEGLQYDLQIERALGCIQDTVRQQKKPQSGCNFAQ